MAYGRSYSASNYRGIPDDPSREKRLAGELRDAIKAGRTYASLTAECRAMFSLATFDRLRGRRPGKN